MTQALLLSLLSLGFFGGFTHCIGMCGPFVVTQVSMRLEKTPLSEFYGFNRLKNFALFPYHLGRITTYSFIGFCCSYLTQNLQDVTGFRIFSAVFLLIGAFAFLKIFFDNNSSVMLSLSKHVSKLRALNTCFDRLSMTLEFINTAPKFFKIPLPFKSKTLKITALTSNLFKNPQGFNGYLLGVILGFLPCGLLYSAFLIAATFPNPLLAAFGMFLFGLGTFPALFIAGHGASLIKITQLKYVTKIIALVNAIMLLLMAIKLIL